VTNFLILRVLGMRPIRYGYTKPIAIPHLELDLCAPCIVIRFQSIPALKTLTRVSDITQARADGAVGTCWTLRDLSSILVYDSQGVDSTGRTWWSQRTMDNAVLGEDAEEEEGFSFL
jgi:hypothetical protein